MIRYFEKEIGKLIYQRIALNSLKLIGICGGFVLLVYLLYYLHTIVLRAAIP